MKRSMAIGVLMLTILAIGSARAAIKYYLMIVREAAYYAADKAATEWWGAGARALGLEGRPVKEEEFKNLLLGYAPDGSRALVQLGRGHQPGWDQTFSAPKSVSVAWALAPPDLQTAIAAAHTRACKEALAFIEERVKTRRGKGGRVLEGCGLVVMLAQHCDNRSGEMQLHTHAVSLNLGFRSSDSSWGALRGRDLYTLKMAGGSVYRAALARELRTLGFKLERGKHAFEISGFPSSVLSEFSTRSKDIRAELASRGETGARAAEAAALRTRRPKVHRQPDEQRAEWLARALRHGVTPQTVSRLIGREKATADVPRKVLRRVVERASEKLAREQSGFTSAQLIRTAARELEHRGPAPSALVESVKEFLTDVRRVGRVPERRRGEDRYAPLWLVAKERSVLEMAEASKSEKRGLRERAVSKALRAHQELSAEQRAALRHVTLGDGAIKCVVGLPGAGKTTLLRATREAFERGRRRVLGVALSAQAARELEKGSGIPSMTVSRLLRTLGPTRGKVLTHHLHQMSRAVRGRKTWKLERETLNRKSVLVIDEASMVATTQVESLLRRARQAGAKVVLVGDPRQLQAIEAGGAFAALSRTLGAAELRSVHRQQRRWMKEAVTMLSEDVDATSALSLYAQHGRVHVHRTGKEAVAGLIAAWAAWRTPELRDTLILGATRGEVDALNRAAQEHRRSERALGSAIRIGARSFREGDRVIITSNHRGLGVVNGDRGTLECIHAVLPNRFARVTLRLDREDAKGRPVRVSFTPVTFDALELGYAMTTHRSQGATVKKTFVLGGGWMQDRELALVQLSRHTDDARLFVTKQDAGEELSILAQSMSRSRQKEFSVMSPGKTAQEVTHEL